MFRHVDLEKPRNLFVVASVLVCGIGGFEVVIGNVTIKKVACAWINGIITNLLLNGGKKADAAEEDAE